ERGEIEPIEEWPIPVRRSAHSGKVDGITVLANHHGPVRQPASYRSARILVSLVRRKIPKQARLLLKIVNVDDEGLSPVPVGIVFRQESSARLLAPREAGIALLGARDFNGGGVEGGAVQPRIV